MHTYTLHLIMHAQVQTTPIHTPLLLSHTHTRARAREQTAPPCSTCSPTLELLSDQLQLSPVYDTHSPIHTHKRARCSTEPCIRHIHKFIHTREQSAPLCHSCSPTLELLSDQLQLSPAVAGATLLAFGNGAPDVMTILASMRSVRFARL